MPRDNPGRWVIQRTSDGYWIAIDPSSGYLDFVYDVWNARHWDNYDSATAFIRACNFEATRDRWKIRLATVTMSGIIHEHSTTE